MKLMIKSCFIGLLLMGAVAIHASGRADTSENVTLIGQLTNFTNSLMDISIVGNYAYVANHDKGLRIINISNPSSPYETGFYDPPGLAHAQGISISGNYAYMAMGNSSGLTIVNITNITNPIHIIDFYTSSLSFDVIFNNNYAYVATSNNGLRIINVSNPNSPIETGFLDTPNSAYGLALKENYIYVADSDSGLRIINITDPANPTEIGFYDTPGSARDVSIDGNHAYVADYNSGLRIINITDPANPTESGFINTPGSAFKVTLRDNYAYIADGASGLRIYNISNPSNPIAAGYYQPSTGNVISVNMVNNLIYVGTSITNNLLILFPTFLATPTSTTTPTFTTTPTYTLTPTYTASPSPTASPTFTTTASKTFTPTITPTPIPPITANYNNPNFKVANNTVTSSIVGKNFLASPIIKLQKSGEPDITATNVIVKSSFLLTCVFDLVNAGHGLYDLFLDRGNSQGTLAKSFNVLRPITETSKWQVKDMGSCGVPLVTGRQNGIAIADPDNDRSNELYVTNRNSNFHQFKFLGAGWARTDLPSALGSERYHDILAFDKDLDTIPELYMAANDHHVYGFSGPGWTKSDLGIASSAVNALAIGDGNNDGEIELYGACEDGHAYQFKWTGSAWIPVDMGLAGGSLKSITVGDGNNDNLFEVYVASADHNVYQYTYTSGWAAIDIGSGAGTMTSVVVADLEDDTTNAVYGANEDGHIYQFKKGPSDWDSQVIGTSNSNYAFFEIVASDGENAGFTRLYGACGDGNIYQFDYVSSNWSATVIGECGTPLYDLAIGDASHDYQHELYAIGDNSHVYQLKYESTIPTATPTATVTATITPIDGFLGKLLDKKFTYFAPNPARGRYFKFVVHVPRQCQIECKLYTTTNKFVLKYNLDCPGPGKYEHQEYVGNLANGVYLLLVKAKSPDGTKERLIKKLGLIK